MSVPRTIVVSPRARDQIREALTWWREHRFKAPRAMVDELKQALVLIGEHPRAGRRLTGRRSDVYYVPLSRVRYALYYREADERTVEVLALWHASRGRLPPEL